MPRGGRRGCSWHRFCHDQEHPYDDSPPPPPPPQIRGRGRCSFASPRRVGHSFFGNFSDEDYFVSEGPSVSHQGPGLPTAFVWGAVPPLSTTGVARPVAVEEPDRCWQCGDLLSNHPQVPPVHVCQDSDEESVPPTYDYRRRIKFRPRRHRGPARRSALVSACSSSSTGSSSPVKDVEHAKESASELKDAVKSLETTGQQIRELCTKMKEGMTVQEVKIKELEDEDASATDGAGADELIATLQQGIQQQYEEFLLSIKHQIHDQTATLRARCRKVKVDQNKLAEQEMKVAERKLVLEMEGADLTAKTQNFAAEQDTFKRDCQDQQKELCRQWQKLNDEMKRMEEVHQVQQGRVKLDVGGHIFTTSSSTLTRDPDSMLAAMFSGRHQLKTELDGSVFIDRDGTHFRYILNYLRDGVTEGSLPDDDQILKELQNEAVYYQITGLIEAIEAKLTETYTTNTLAKEESKIWH